MSVSFGGGADHTGFDSITLGSSTPGSNVPEPASLTLFGTGLLAAWRARRKKVGRS